jgi:DNA-binding response OmpR family regulator
MPDYTILIIDYEPRSVYKLTALFEGAGYQVRVARDGVRGIHEFEHVQPDLTLVEAMLPRKSGFDVCQALKQTEHGQSTPVLIITAVYKGRRYRSEARYKYGCDEYIEKPVDDELLLETVRAHLHRRSMAAASAAEASQPTSEKTDKPDTARPDPHRPPGAKPSKPALEP